MLLMTFIPALKQIRLLLNKNSTALRRGGFLKAGGYFSSWRLRLGAYWKGRIRDQGFRRGNSVQSKFTAESCQLFFQSCDVKGSVIRKWVSAYGLG